MPDDDVSKCHSKHRVTGSCLGRRTGIYYTCDEIRPAKSREKQQQKRKTTQPTQGIAQLSCKQIAVPQMPRKKSFCKGMSLFHKTCTRDWEKLWSRKRIVCRRHSSREKNSESEWNVVVKESEEIFRWDFTLELNVMLCPMKEKLFEPKVKLVFYSRHNIKIIGKKYGAAWRQREILSCGITETIKDIFWT